ncbi:MAG TPA: winged helix DNA-binding domain-containing protein [Acidimicrobiia bacterium]|nr:winged helix DNA-binding domain-containing protein [Acidimicrobiia bacterium]
MDRIPARVLNRTTLHRQALLDRSDSTAAAMIEHVVGMQAQNPNDPYFALWARLTSFDQSELSTMIREGLAVRGQLMRATIHLVTTRDFLALRPQLQTVCARTLGSTSFARDTAAVDRSALLNEGRALLEERPMTRAQLGGALEPRWPGVPPASLAQVVTYLLPVVQVPPRGMWQRSAPAAWTTIEGLTGGELGDEPPVEDTVLRYLAAFGPASIKDVRAWSGLPGLREIVDRIRPRLRTFVNDSGVELLDLPDATLVEPDVPAPPRFLPEYDNVLLGHADRSRFFLEGVIPEGWRGNLMIDGMFSGSWKVGHDRRGTRLEIDLKRKVGKSELQAATGEADRLLAVAFPEAANRDVEVVA